MYTLMQINIHTAGAYAGVYVDAYSSGHLV